MKRRPRWLLLLILALSTMACQAAARLFTGALPTPARPTSLAAAAPMPTPKLSCADEARSVARAANMPSLPMRFPPVDTSTDLDVHLVSYSIQGNELSAPVLFTVQDSLMPYQRDFATQKAAWRLFTTMIPAEQRAVLHQYEIITDGPGGVLSAVEQTADDPQSWILEADIADMRDTKSLAFTLLHEFGHLLTLGPAQVPPDARTASTAGNSHARHGAESACASYFPGEGCSRTDSYINMFFNRFWKNIYDSWSEIDQVQDGDRREVALHAFYRRNQDQFVDSYAVTSPVEDIAESWAFFVLSPRPTGDKIRDQKLDFFYSYPELAALRERVLQGLCEANP